MHRMCGLVRFLVRDSRLSAILLALILVLISALVGGQVVRPSISCIFSLPGAADWGLLGSYEVLV